MTPPRTITISAFDRDLPRAIRLAKKPGGLNVVGPDGELRFRLAIPAKDLPLAFPTGVR